MKSWLLCLQILLNARNVETAQHTPRSGFSENPHLETWIKPFEEPAIRSLFIHICCLTISWCQDSRKTYFTWEQPSVWSEAEAAKGQCVFSFLLTEGCLVLKRPRSEGGKNVCVVHAFLCRVFTFAYKNLDSGKQGLCSGFTLVRFGCSVKKLASSSASFIADFLLTPQEHRDKKYFESFLDKVASCPRCILKLNLCNWRVCSNLFKCKRLSA